VGRKGGLFGWATQPNRSVGARGTKPKNVNVVRDPVWFRATGGAAPADGPFRKGGLPDFVLLANLKG